MSSTIQDQAATAANDREIANWNALRVAPLITRAEDLVDGHTIRQRVRLLTQHLADNTLKDAPNGRDSSCTESTYGWPYGRVFRDEGACRRAWIEDAGAGQALAAKTLTTTTATTAERSPTWFLPPSLAADAVMADAANILGSVTPFSAGIGASPTSTTMTTTAHENGNDSPLRIKATWTVARLDHPDLVNMQRLPEFVQQCNVDTRTSMLCRSVPRLAMVTSQNDYLALRGRQNRAWAAESVRSGRDCMAKGNLAGASKAFTHAFQIDAQYVEAHRGMAELHFIEKKPVEALGELEKALLIEPLHGEVFTLYERTIDTELSLAERVQYRSSLSYRSIIEKRRVEMQQKPTPSPMHRYDQQLLPPPPPPRQARTADQDGLLPVNETLQPSALAPPPLPLHHRPLPPPVAHAYPPMPLHGSQPLTSASKEWDRPAPSSSSKDWDRYGPPSSSSKQDRDRRRRSRSRTRSSSRSSSRGGHRRRRDRRSSRKDGGRSDRNRQRRSRSRSRERMRSASSGRRHGGMEEQAPRRNGPQSAVADRSSETTSMTRHRDSARPRESINSGRDPAGDIRREESGSRQRGRSRSRSRSPRRRRRSSSRSVDRYSRHRSPGPMYHPDDRGARRRSPAPMYRPDDSDAWSRSPAPVYRPDDRGPRPYSPGPMYRPDDRGPRTRSPAPVYRPDDRGPRPRSPIPARHSNDQRPRPRSPSREGGPRYENDRRSFVPTARSPPPREQRQYDYDRPLAPPRSGNRPLLPPPRIDDHPLHPPIHDRQPPPRTDNRRHSVDRRDYPRIQAPRRENVPWPPKPRPDQHDGRPQPAPSTPAGPQPVIEHWRQVVDGPPTAHWKQPVEEPAKGPAPSDQREDGEI